MNPFLLLKRCPALLPGLLLLVAGPELTAQAPAHTVTVSPASVCVGSATTYTVTVTVTANGSLGSEIINVPADLGVPGSITIVSVSGNKSWVSNTSSGQSIRLNATNNGNALLDNNQSITFTFQATASVAGTKLWGSGTGYSKNDFSTGPTSSTAPHPSTTVNGGGGSVAGGTTPLCQGSGAGTLTLSGHIGTILRWEKQLNGGGYTTIANTATTYSEVPTSAGVWNYRAVIQNPTCGVVNSTAVTITVNAPSVGGSVGGGTTPLCQGGGAGTLTLSGNSGSVLRWEKQLNGGDTPPSRIPHRPTAKRPPPPEAGTTAPSCRTVPARPPIRRRAAFRSTPLRSAAASAEGVPL